MPEAWAGLDTPHCLPPLEDLIVHLLAKDPAARPASAQEALTALGTVDPAQKSATHSDASALERLARGVFVGRGQELEKLRRAFDEAFAPSVPRRSLGLLTACPNS